MKTQKQQNIGY